MDPTLEKISDALDTLAKRVREQPRYESLNQTQGWHHPSISTEDLALRASRLSAKIRESGATLTPELTASLASFPQKLESLYGSQTIAHMFNGHGDRATAAYLNTLSTLEAFVSDFLGWQAMEDPKSMPPSVAKRVRTLKAEVDGLAISVPQLAARVSVINSAYEAAQNLPVDLAALQEARSTATDAAEHTSKTSRDVGEIRNQIALMADEIEKIRSRAASVLSECEDTYRITTAKGLAASFYQTSDRLRLTIWVWVLFLAVALVAGAFIGAERVIAMNELLRGQPAWGAIWMNLVLSVVSIAAPVWFAWLATKQIGQRFRLSEDYAYKAAVSQAYEGFRREAAKYSPEFAERLLESALARLDEPPLRWVETNSHGSPWHEFIESDSFRKALASVPNLRERLSSMLQKTKPTADDAGDEVNSDGKRTLANGSENRGPK